MDKEKYVDESWKESAETEKEKLEEISKNTQQNTESQPTVTPEGAQNEVEKAEPQGGQSPESDHVTIHFMNYITSLGFQAMIFLGEVPNPVTNETDKNLEQAKFLIDTMSVLKEKTKGNLSTQEENLLNASVYELQMKYVELIEQEQATDDQP